jgi:hypothetical protein
MPLVYAVRPKRGAAVALLKSDEKINENQKIPVSLLRPWATITKLDRRGVGATHPDIYTF